ncbi:MAG: tetratricopeptide repeat protein [Bacteroidales bacterium]|nr:tetratricopeptide repeat protein [Bacteroidales bacterium]
MAKNRKAQEEPQVETQSNSFESFVKKYQNIIFWTVIGILLIVFGILAYQKWILTPAKEEARSQMFVAEQQFRAGNYEQALNGDGNNLGFLQVMDQYGRKAGEAVYFYAGLCQYNLGNWAEAADLFKKYNGKDEILKGRALCCTGDAYANLGDNHAALSWYKKAAAAGENTYRAGYLFKEGRMQEMLGNEKEALKCYKEIEVRYPQSMEAYDIAKYISRIENK